MATTAKAQQLSKNLFDVLKLRLPALIATETVGTTGHPILIFQESSTMTSNQSNALIRIIPETASLATDILGNAAQVYTPHKIQLCTEKNYASTVDTVADNLSTQEVLSIVGELIMTGCTVEWYTTTYATVPAEAEITAANLVATFKTLIHWPLAGQ